MGENWVELSIDSPYNLNSNNSLHPGRKLDNIKADLHVHSELSDGINLYDLTRTAKVLGLSTVSMADHVRQSWDDIDFYNQSAYEIGAEEWLLAENMEVLDEIISVWENELQVYEAELSQQELDHLVHEGVVEPLTTYEDLIGFARDEGKHLNIGRSFEQDYESWNEDIIEEFLVKHQPDYVPLSVHYIDLEEWDKAKYFRLSDFDELSDDALARAAQNYLDEYKRKMDFGARMENKLGMPVIETHMDGPLRNKNLRPYIQQEDFHKLLDYAEEKDRTVEINARVMRKLVEDESEDFDRNYAEWFSREVARRAEAGELNFIVSSDGHSVDGMVKSLLMVDKVLDDYDIQSPGYEEFLERSSVAAGGDPHLVV